MMSSPASFGALAVALVTTAGWAASPPAGPLPPPEDLDLARALFKAMVEIKSTHDAGSTALARAVEEHLVRVGFARPSGRGLVKGRSAE